MGYPDKFKITVSDTQAYRQFGNSVVVPVVERIAKEVVRSLNMAPDEVPDLVLAETQKPYGKNPAKKVKKTVKVRAKK